MSKESVKNAHHNSWDQYNVFKFNVLSNQQSKTQRYSMWMWHKTERSHKSSHFESVCLINDFIIKIHSENNWIIVSALVNINQQHTKHEFVFTSVMMALCCRTLWYSGSSLTLCAVESCIALPSRHKTAWHLPTLAAFSVKQPLCSPGATGSCLMWHKAAEPPILWPAVPSFLPESNTQTFSARVCEITVTAVSRVLFRDWYNVRVYRCMVRKVLVM